MRIIGGNFRGRNILFPDKKKVRPTKDRIREAIFNVISKKVPGAKVLDIFAGSGAYGLEALSRGAESAVFVDNAEDCCDVISKNIRTLGLNEDSSIKRCDVFDIIEGINSKKYKFDLIFADPPYDMGLAKKVLIMVNQYDILSSSGLLIIEHSKHESLPELEGKLSFFKQKTYKNINISYFC